MTIDNATYARKAPSLIIQSKYRVGKVVFKGLDVLEDSRSVAWLKNLVRLGSPYGGTKTKEPYRFASPRRAAILKPPEKHQDKENLK